MLWVKKHSMHFWKKLHICNSAYPHICISFAINCICMKTNLLEIDGEPKKNIGVSPVRSSCCPRPERSST